VAEHGSMSVSLRGDRVNCKYGVGMIELSLHFGGDGFPQAVRTASGADVPRILGCASAEWTHFEPFTPCSGRQHRPAARRYRTTKAGSPNVRVSREDLARSAANRPSRARSRPSLRRRRPGRAARYTGHSAGARASRALQACGRGSRIMPAPTRKRSVRAPPTC
jgi:hypothetical protein